MIKVSPLNTIDKYISKIRKKGKECNIDFIEKYVECADDTKYYEIDITLPENDNYRCRLFKMEWGGSFCPVMLYIGWGIIGMSSFYIIENDRDLKNKLNKIVKSKELESILNNYKNREDK